MQTSAVIPVLVIDDAATAKPLAQALVAGGLRVLEVTLRTPAAMEAIAEMKTVPGAIVGAGTVVNEAQAKAVIDAGVEFIVSPGLTERLARPILDAGCRFCPTGGITEASAPDWLAFDPVLCVGGSWVTGGSMADVEAKARAASALRR
ncbi:hypothetical protein WR25_27085 [Diploscapter pachys]|uniref:2-dehydro-3-deoxy-phosphogluconate aldolase n=1 Tax=Diploscapter pachys TaxID=2018661 RepID=A0A2A2KK58_9BILA|nr:hypothetical protein WR25_27085 [Diploscapter pachys]